MLGGASLSLPASLMALLTLFRPCFTEPTFRTFCALGGGFLAQPGRRTVCGMLMGAGLSRLWSHHGAHRFFSHARWSSEAVSAVLTRLVVDRLVPAGDAVVVAVDDTLFKRTGGKVHAASWFHDGSGTGRRQVGYGNQGYSCDRTGHKMSLRRQVKDATECGPRARNAGQVLSDE